MPLSTIILSLVTSLALQNPVAAVNNASNNTSTSPILATTSVVVDQPIVADVTAEPKKTITVEEQVRAYFSDIPVLIDVARCESTFRQTDTDGKVIRGLVNPEDVGVMQINEHYHKENAEHLGYDINTLDGNIAFARHLYGIYGTEPWSASQKCWDKTAK